MNRSPGGAPGPFGGGARDGGTAGRRPPASTAAAVAATVGALVLVQLLAGVFSQSAAVVALGVGLALGAVALPAALPGGRGVLPAVGLSAAGVAQALMAAPAGSSAVVLVVLGLWLPAAAVALALGDEDQRATVAPLAVPARGGRSGGLPEWEGPDGSGGARPSGARRWRQRAGGPPQAGAGSAAGAGGAAGTAGAPPTGTGGRRVNPVRSRLVMSALAAGAIIAVVAALAAAFVRPPGRGDGAGRDGPGWGDIARAGRPAESLGVYQAADRLDTGRRLDLSDQVVMKVRASAPDFWRGTTYDQWDGRVWTRTPPTGDPAVEEPWASGIGRSTRPRRGSGDGGVGSEVALETLVQTFTVVAGGSDLLFGAYRPVQHVTGAARPRLASDGTASVDRPLGPGARYGVVSRRPLVTAEILQQADPLVGPLPDGMAERYLALPAVPDRVRRLARDITSGHVGAYDKVRALERWLGDNTTYTLDIPALPEGADAIEQFLFVDRRGYCEQIASSLAVMLRSVGVPSRLGVGYASGERRWGSDEFEVRGRDAHAWVEVWFPGVGWQVFDPTAEVPLSGEADSPALFDRWGWWVGLVAALLAAAALVTVVVRRRRRGAERWEGQVLHRLEAAGGRLGRPRRPAETAAEYTRALAEGPLAAPGLHEVAETLERSTFGPAAADEVERRRVTLLVDQAIATAPRSARRRLVGGRAP